VNARYLNWEAELVVFEKGLIPDIQADRTADPAEE
jgi:hypothetical protein